MDGILRIHSADNVAVALRDLAAGDVVAGVSARAAIPRGHKIALAPIAAGAHVIKYGYAIGRATSPIAPGEHVHTHNVGSDLHGHLSANGRRGAAAANVNGGITPRRTFDGYRRGDGRVGTRNEIWIVNTVGCVNRASEQIAQRATQQFCTPGSPIDGVHAFTHPFGCSQLGDDLHNTQKVLAGLVRHPNAGGVLVLGLGCENNQLKMLMDLVGPHDPQRVRFFNAQDVEDEIEAGLAEVEKLVTYASRSRREPVDASELVLAMKCGGSDGLSGITANPLVGRIADRLSALGGTSLLSEVPEMFGAEQVLLDRGADERVVDDTIRMVNEFRDYFRSQNQPIDENPSPGNKEGGITTLAEKSLGCVQKGGTAPVRQVVGYGEPASPRLGGVALVNAPGNDGVSTTAMSVAGATVVLFTTGRGTPMGFPVPTIKIATNSALAERKPSWIDFNAGPIAEGADIDELADQLFDFVLDVASGRTLARNELNGNREIAIWKTGVTV